MCNNVQYYDNIYDVRTGKLYPVPCHYCEGCRIDRRVMWENRIASEYVRYRCAFVTFTFDEYHLKWNKGSALPTLCANDFSKFLDSFRHKIRSLPVFPEFCTKDYKVVAVGEYGSDRYRPHYHALFLGLDWLYFRPYFEKYWRNGIVDVGPIYSGGIRYILKYMEKQQFGEYAHIAFTDKGIEIPKMFFSPGIGKDFFISQVNNINKYGCAKVGQRLIPVPSYWKNKLFNYCDENIYKREQYNNAYAKKMNDFAVSMGFDSYDGYLRQARKALEHSYECYKLKRHEPVQFFSQNIPDYRQSPFHELVTQYRDTPLMSLFDKRST